MSSMYADDNTLLEATLTVDLYIFDMRDAMSHQRVMLVSRSIASGMMQ